MANTPPTVPPIINTGFLVGFGGVRAVEISEVGEYEAPIDIVGDNVGVADIVGDKVGIADIVGDKVGIAVLDLLHKMQSSLSVHFPRLNLC